MRRLCFYALLIGSGCSRSFVAAPSLAPSAGPPSIHSLGFSSGQPLPSNSAVVAGAALTATGVNLSSAATVTVGGLPVLSQQLLSSSAIEFTVPHPSPDSIGQLVPVVVVQGAVTIAVPQSLRVYDVPSITGVQPLGVELPASEVVSPGLMVISGENFSPVVLENYVTVGGASAEVISANPEQLLVSLNTDSKTGNTQSFVNVIPSGSEDLGLVSDGGFTYVWESVDQVWFWPRQVFGQQTSEGIRSGLFPQARVTELDQFGLSSLSQPPAPPQPWAAMNFFPNASVDSGPSDAGLMVDTVGDGGTTGGGFAGYCAGAGAGGGSAANPNLMVVVDGAGVNGAQVGYADAGATTHWKFVPKAEQAGVHQVQLANPAGLSVADQVVWLQGHLIAPTLSCYSSPIPWSGPSGGLAPASLLSTQAFGAVVGSSQVQSGSSLRVTTVQFDPGGAAEAPGSVTFPSTDGGPYQLLGAGRHLVYLGQGTAGGATVQAISIGSDGGLPIAIDAGSGLVPLAVREPTLDDSTLWIALGQPAGAAASGSGALVTLAALPILTDGGSWDGGAFVVGTLFDTGLSDLCLGAQPIRLVTVRWAAEGLQLVADCVGGSSLWYGVLPTPYALQGADAGPFQTSWTSLFLEIADGGLPNEPWSAALTDTSVQVLTPDEGGADLYMGSLSLVDSACNSAVAFQDPSIEAASPSPDGSQVVGVHRVQPGSAEVRIYQSPGTAGGTSWNWSAYPLPLGTAAYSASFDLSGSQVIIATGPDPLLSPDSGPPAGYGYCILH